MRLPRSQPQNPLQLPKYFRRSSLIAVPLLMAMVGLSYGAWFGCRQARGSSLLGAQCFDRVYQTSAACREQTREQRGHAEHSEGCAELHRIVTRMFARRPLQ